MANVTAASRVVLHTSRARLLLKNGGPLRSAIPFREVSATVPTVNSVMKVVSRNLVRLLILIAVLQRPAHAMHFREATATTAPHADTLTMVDSERLLHMECSTHSTSQHHVVEVVVCAIHSREVSAIVELLADSATATPLPPSAITEDQKQLVSVLHFKVAPATAVKVVDLPMVMLELSFQHRSLVNRKPAMHSRPAHASTELLVSSSITCLLLWVKVSSKLWAAV